MPDHPMALDEVELEAGSHLLGQVIEYRELMAAAAGEPVAGALLLERLEPDDWTVVAASAGVEIIDGAAIEASVDALLRSRTG